MFTSKIKNSFLKPWEIAALLALSISLCAGLWAAREQRELAGALVRLHVIADSDSAYDQKRKLLVRDAVLERLTPALETAATPAEARATIERLLPELSALGESVSGQTARAVLGWERYPTRLYDGFALPAGDYLSLRLELGEAKGQNWWCVVFPPLCAAAVEGTGTLDAMLTQSDAALVTGDGEGYVLKFRLMELWEQLRGWLS